MFCLSMRNGEEEWHDRIAAFYEGYGALEKSSTMRFRQEVYHAMHVGSSALWGAKQGEQHYIEGGRQDLRGIVGLLPQLLN